MEEEHNTRILITGAELNAFLELAPTITTPRTEEVREFLGLPSSSAGTLAAGTASLIEKGLLERSPLGVGYLPSGVMREYSPVLWKPQDIMDFIFRTEGQHSAGVVLASVEGPALICFSAGGGYFFLSPALSRSSGGPFADYGEIAHTLLSEFIILATDQVAVALHLSTLQRDVRVNALSPEKKNRAWEVATLDAEIGTDTEMSSLNTVHDSAGLLALVRNGPLSLYSVKQKR